MKTTLVHLNIESEDSLVDNDNHIDMITSIVQDYLYKNCIGQINVTCPMFEEIASDEFEPIIVDSFYIRNSYGFLQLIQIEEEKWIVGWNAINSLSDPDWSYSVQGFDSIDKAYEYFNVIIGK